MRDEGAALYKKANMDLGDTIDAVGAPLPKGCKEESFAALAADIQRYTADAAQLTKEIAELMKTSPSGRETSKQQLMLGISKRWTTTRFTRIILNLLMPCSIHRSFEETGL